MAKSVFEQASMSRGEAATKTATGLVYLAEALIDMATELQDVKTLLNKQRKDMNENADRAKSSRSALRRNG